MLVHLQKKTSLIRMTKYAIDAYAWIEYLDGTARGEMVGRILEDKNNEANTCVVTYAEVMSKFLRCNKNPDSAREAMSTLSKIIPVDELFAEEAARHHAQLRKKMNTFGLADAFIVAMAERLQLKIVTGDQHFRDIKGVMLI